MQPRFSFVEMDKSLRMQRQAPGTADGQGNRRISVSKVGEFRKKVGSIGSIVDTAQAVSQDPSTPNMNFYDPFEYIVPVIIPEEAL